MDMWNYEKIARNDGYKKICGVDEAGRGPICGPLVVASCILPFDFELDGLTDSKKLTEKKLSIFYDYIIENATEYNVCFIEKEIIDEINIYQATKVGMKKVIESVDCDYALIDAMKFDDLDKPHLSIIKGDSKSISIAAASVLAKVSRDRYMIELHKKYNMYGFDRHKGYPTKFHKEMLKEHGKIEEHRESFSPVKNTTKTNCNII